MIGLKFFRASLFFMRKCGFRKRVWHNLLFVIWNSIWTVVWPISVNWTPCTSHYHKRSYLCARSLIFGAWSNNHWSFLISCVYALCFRIQSTSTTLTFAPSCPLKIIARVLNGLRSGKNIFKYLSKIWIEPRKKAKNKPLSRLFLKSG